MYLKLFLFCYAFLYSTGMPAQSQCLKNAHSHNDYKQKNPLTDALKYRFSSIEADVFLINNQLIVSHLHPLLKKQNLESLYLRPLKEICEKQNGKIYEDASLILLIDIKSDAGETYAVLRELLGKYRSMLTRYENNVLITGSVTIILSGNRPYDEVQKENSRLVFIDQSLMGLDKLFSKDICPMASTSYSSIFKWKGKGTVPPEEKQKLVQLVNQAHEQGKKVRLWASPENKNVWKELLSCGVDLINTDKLEELKTFLTEYQSGHLPIDEGG